MAAHGRHRVSVDHRGRGAWVLAHLGRDRRGERHGQARGGLAEDLAHARLVGGEARRVQEADGDGLHAFLDEPARDRAHLGLVERRDDTPVHRHPLGHVEAEVARDQRLGIADAEVVEVVAGLGADTQQVAEAAGDARALQHRVGDDGRRPEDPQRLAAHAARPREHFIDPLQHRQRRIGGRAEHLVDVHAAGVVQQREVGEGSAGVEAELHPAGVSSRNAAIACHSSAYVV